MSALGQELGLPWRAGIDVFILSRLQTSGRDSSIDLRGRRESLLLNLMCIARLALQLVGHCTEASVFEYISHGDLELLASEPADEIDGGNGIAAEAEEVGFQTKVIVGKLQCFDPSLLQHLLRLRRQRDNRTL